MTAGESRICFAKACRSGRALWPAAEPPAENTTSRHAAAPATPNRRRMSAPPPLEPTTRRRHRRAQTGKVKHSTPHMSKLAGGLVEQLSHLLACCRDDAPNSQLFPAP